MKYSLLSIFIFAGIAASSQVNIPEAEIQAYRTTSPEHLVTGSIYKADSILIKGFGSADIKTSINYLPGVKMDTRGNGGSRRIQIRGTSFRSPYSVRNTMFIYDGFVFTEGDGNSPVELLDPDFISSINIISGPAAASYGGSYGGAILVEGNNYKVADGISVAARNMVESTGREGMQARMSATILKPSNNGTLSISYVQTDNIGYRDWEWNDKRHFELKRHFSGKKNGEHLIYLGFYDGNWALPGSINSSSSDTIPTLSPGLDYKANVDRKRNMLGYKYATQTEGGWKYKFSLLGRNSNKTNIYGTSPFYNGYKEEGLIGGSSLFSVSKELLSNEDLTIEFESTLMYLRDLYDLSDYDLANNEISYAFSNLNYDIDLLADQAFASTGITAIIDKLRIDAQIGANRRTRRTLALTRVDESNTIHDFSSENISILPRIGLSYEISEKLSTYAQASTGFSDPTVFELVDTETSELVDLNPEESVGLEFGLRIKPLENFDINIVAYNQKVNNAILQKVAENDAVSFENIDGGLLLSGLELSLDYRINDVYRVSGFATLTDHIFGENTDHPGNYVPGSTNTTSGLLLSRKGKYYETMLGARHTGQMYANNTNADTIAAYTVVDFSLNRKLPINLEIEGGIKNVLNTSYSDWIQLNGVNGKFFNPAPPRTFYVSIRSFIR